MTDLDDAFVEAVAQTALEIDHHGTDVLLRAPEAAPTFGAASVHDADDGDDDDDRAAVVLDGGRDDAVLEVVVGGDVVGMIVPVGDGYGVLVVPEDGEEPSDAIDTLEDALDELGVCPAPTPDTTDAPTIWSGLLAGGDGGI